MLLDLQYQNAKIRANETKLHPISQSPRLVSGKNSPNRIAAEGGLSSNRILRMWQHNLHTWALNNLESLIMNKITGRMIMSFAIQTLESPGSLCKTGKSQGSRGILSFCRARRKSGNPSLQYMHTA